ncbi:uncharacterized protein LOC120806934 [Xiphias gladius]|uniref:uncharacterized protein LOC120806934 n=1 Tax=Xiphias gladius TaxID=8245 RepID=UPI001A98DA6F|nr:uncharacterized protein LOC120806934 [Xiphias gladius]XP_040014416.1 uncharacterized protein LOC120806934 [Xiphias gladius]XP_040014417.1 uncharacterized protein LOC120806934 [Xiphias gladius]XP_040014418.1 uncharacterized protein LOC120806934 [Xiphias gladius]XP_040014419.1 uncharacterized protein LOC120806934 [Xiphias gladius]XP_040014420.1 uncharacterized protein LOC120806934 [Xiphias gladius]
MKRMMNTRTVPHWTRMQSQIAHSYPEEKKVQVRVRNLKNIIKRQRQRKSKWKKSKKSLQKTMLELPTLEPVSALPTLSAKEQDHVNVKQITWEATHSLEHSTCGCKESVEELRKLCLTSCFREICKLKPGQSHAERLISKIRNGFPRCKTAQIEEEMKTDVLREYCQHQCVNWFPCGLVVHPNPPWLGALPDGLAYDPDGKPSFRLVHVKCIRFRSFLDCGFLVCRDGALKLKTTHSYPWHIQGEMRATSTSWCNLFVFSTEDILVQRIYHDKVIIKVMKKKLHDFFFLFFFCYYLPSVFYTGVTA